MKNIAIFGVGRMGQSLVQELLRENIYHKIYLYGRDETKLNSAILSLNLYSSFINSTTIIEKKQGDLPTDVDIIAITLKDGYDPRLLINTAALPKGLTKNIRNIGIGRDLPILYDVCRKINNFKGIVVVITNPVDIFTVLVKKWIPNAKIYGFGVSLDSARLAFCAQKEGINCFYNECPIGGSHTEFLVPFTSIWDKSSPISCQDESQVKKLIKSVSDIGPKIVKGLGYTLHDCSVVFSKDLAWLASKDDKRKYLCISMGTETSAVGRPIYRNKIGAISDATIILNEKEINNLIYAEKITERAVSVVNNYYLR